MLRVNAVVEPYNYNRVTFKQSALKQEKKPTNKTKVVAYSAIGATIMAGVIYGIVHRNSRAITKSKETVVNSIKEVFEKQMAQFPEDIDYRKLLIKNTGLNQADWYKLRPIAGPQEYANIIKEFSDNATHYTSGNKLIADLQDNYVLSGIDTRTFRANMHMHTVHSDGKLTVQELLDKSAKYADEVAATSPQKAKHAPFTIAITDHDTLGGCKEAVKIISQNPEKYKNLRVVLGVEMTVENRMLGANLNAPVPIHMTVLGLDPYSPELNRFFNEKKQCRADLMRKIIQRCSKIMPEVSENFSFEEAEKLNTFLKNKLTHINFSMKDYLQKKIIDSGYYKNNPEVLGHRLQQVHNICMDELPKMDLNPAFVDMEDAISLIKNQPYGYMSWAHPGCTGIGSYLKDGNSYKGMETIFKLFKEKGGERAFAAEIHYPYFGELGRSADWLNAIKYYAKTNNLYWSGGLDTHGKNIFYSRK